MEKLDDYIKTILDQSEPVYNNEFWEQTSKYIENKRKRRFFFYVWLSVGLFILFLGVGSIFIFTNGKQHGLEKADEFSQPIAAITPQKNKETAQKSSVAEVNYNKSPQTTINIPTAYHSSLHLSPKDNVKAYKNSNTTSISNDNSILKNDSVESPAILSENHLIIPNNKYSDLINSTHFSSLSVLALPFRIEFHNELKLSEIKLLETNDIVNDPLYSKLSYYINLGGILNPVINQNQKWSLGMTGGFGINFDYKQKISLQAGISYLHRWGTFNVMIDHPTPIYDFTKDDRGYSLVPTDAGYLTFPLSLGIPFGKNTFGFGINSMRLLGAKGNVFAYEGLPVENDPDKVVYRSTQISSGWIETPGFRKWVFEYNLFLERQMNKHINVGLRFGYLPKGLVKSDYNFYFDNESMNYIERESAGLLENNYHMTLYMTYKL